MVTKRPARAGAATTSRTDTLEAVAEPDEALLEAWRNGDTRAGAALFHRHFSAMSRFFRNKLGDGHADDLIQATFLACVEARDRFTGEGSFRSYLFGIAYNLLREHARARGRETTAETELFAIDLGPRPSALLARKAEERALLEGLRRIPLEHQTLLELYFWEALCAREIGLIFGVPEGTIRTRLRRAKELLGRELSRVSGEALASTLTRLDEWARAVRPDAAASG
jgi:RNA polymerase sigma factor (sigma-70 family)